MSDADNLTKIYVEMPGHWAFGGESLWAKPLGGDLYRIENVPFHAYGLNYGDVVRALADEPSLKPQVREVVEASGHRTIRILFENDLPETSQHPYLGKLVELGATYERANAIHLALDISPETTYQAVVDQLWQWEQDGIIGFETGETRVAGTFTSAPDEGESEAAAPSTSRPWWKFWRAGV